MLTTVGSTIVGSTIVPCLLWEPGAAVGSPLFNSVVELLWATAVKRGPVLAAATGT